MLFSTVITVIVIDFRTICLPKKLKYNEIQLQLQDRTKDTAPRKGDGMRDITYKKGVKGIRKLLVPMPFTLLYAKMSVENRTRFLSQVAKICDYSETSKRKEQFLQKKNECTHNCIWAHSVSETKAEI